MTITLDRLQATFPPLPPAFDVRVLRMIQVLAPYFVHWQSRINRVEEHNIERLVAAQHQFDLGKVRCIYAFRHPTTDDHFSLLHLFSRSMPCKARQMGIKLHRPIHAFFVYDRGIPLWAGGITNWLFPRLGGIPVYRGKADRQGMKSIRDHIVSGSFPLAIAPEGGTNGQSERVGELEPGAVQLGFWAAEDLQKANRPEQVLIVPIGIQYEYTSQSWARIDQLLLGIERDCGISKPKPTPRDRYQRLYDLGIFLVQWVAVHYQKYYPQYAQSCDPHASLAEQLETVIETILRTAEANFRIVGKGSYVDRCRRLEQAVWDQVFRVEDWQKLTVLERCFGDQLAREANNSLWHMRIAESILHITGTYVQEHPSPSRFAEMLLLLWRAMSRLKLIPYGKTPYLGDRKLILSGGEPINISAHLSQYQTNRQTAKETMAELTNQLRNSMQSLVIPSALT